ncbi:MAG: DUF5908 family protein [Cyclobacteriaceae bacterium]|jgi:hypothetical protein|nr:DUF5908 family protein [Cyclobacteriaceae bacterium]
MPIEVRELVITGVVVQEGSEGGSTPATTDTHGNNANPQEEMIKMCADKVLQILKDKDER